MTASHHELDLEALEHLSAGAQSMGSSAVRACEMISGVVVLATCNRFELYLDVADPARGATPSDSSSTAVPVPHDGPSERDLAHAADEIARLIARSSGVDLEATRTAFTVRSGDDVVAHLFSVAAGLDSMVVGEREIAGQVRRALDAAHDEGTTDARLERLFQRASHTSKKVAHTTRLGADGRSVVSVGLDLAERSLPPWRQASVVVVGTGAYAGASVAALRARGCTDISVFSASGRGEQFAQDRGITVAASLIDAVGGADLVVSCSGAGPARRLTDGGQLAAPEHANLEYIPETAAVLAARERAAERVGEPAPARPLVVLDLALHHDVNPRVGDLDQVLLMDLGTIRSHAPSAHSEPVRAARRVVAEATEAFAAEEAVRRADALVVALRDLTTAHVEAELGRTLHDAPATTLSLDERLLRRKAARALHEALGSLRSTVAQGGTLHPQDALSDLRAQLEAATPAPLGLR